MIIEVIEVLYMFDCHIHTGFSTDSNMLLRDAIRMGEDKGLGIIITEHMDLLYPDGDKFYFDVEEYFDTYTKYRSDRVLLGMEMGMRLDCLKENKSFHSDYIFDYIIGSTHLVNGIDIYRPEYYEARGKREAYEEYFTYMLKCLKSYDFVDSLGHIDYIARYARVEDQEIYYDEYSDYLDEIFKVLINGNKAIELNTRRLSDKETVNNLLEIYKRFGELGGKYVTLGSDAHNYDDIGRNFNAAEEIAEICGLNIVHFKERKMILSK